METQLQKISYALGLSMGNNFRSSGILDIDVDSFAQGVAAVFGKAEQKMSYNDAKSIIHDFFEEMEKRQQAQIAELAKANAEAGEKFLAENSTRAEVSTTPSDLQYEVLSEGKGPKPSPTDRVKVHYTGRLIDGSVFDSSVERGEPATFGVTQVIPGWVEALQMMNQGSKWRIYIPAKLAYGENGAAPTIGPNATLIFDVELLEVIK